MDERDLDALRAIVTPLDVDPLFLVVGGDHLTGFPAPDSEVRVSGAHRSAFGASLGPGRNTNRLDLDLLDRGLSVRIVSSSVGHAAERLRRGDAAFVEELHSPVRLAGDEEADRLREIAGGLLTRGIADHYSRLAGAASAELGRGKSIRVRAFLRLFRALLAGIHVLERRRVEPDLRRLAEAFDCGWLRELLAKPERGAVVGNPSRAGFWFAEAERLGERFAQATRETVLPAEPGGLERLDDWEADYSGFATGT